MRITPRRVGGGIEVCFAYFFMDVSRLHTMKHVSLGQVIVPSLPQFPIKVSMGEPSK